MSAAQPPKTRRVAIIGAGPAGLSATHQLLSLSSPCASRAFDVTLFDRRQNHSGVWGYDPESGPCVVRYDPSGRAYPLWSGSLEHGSQGGRFRPPGAMYDGLRTNLPCDIMAYRSFPYPASTPLFPSRAQVETYIDSFASSVLEGREVNVRLNTAVSDVRRVAHERMEGKIGWGSMWSVKSIDIESGKETVEAFENVVVASGRCSTPNIPYIKGLNRFKGVILHSAWWRSPLPYEGKKVLVVGNSSSGSDIARELAGYVLRTLPEGEAATQSYIERCSAGKKGKESRRVLHSYEHLDKPPPLDYDPREEESPDWAKRITVVPRIESIDEERRVVFKEDKAERREDGIEVIIFATGYSYDFPYLPQDQPPFDKKPLIPLPPNASEKSGEEGGDYIPPSRTAPFLTNLDDWSLFYGPDPSICVLGAPIRIVPMPLTHVQSRIVAACWAGEVAPWRGSTGLPRLDPTVPSTDAKKWSSVVGKGEEGGNKTSDLGFPSDSAYQDALFSLLPQHLREKGEDEMVKVPEATEEVEARVEARGEAGGKEIGQSLRPVVAEDEGWSRMADFRNERRADTKRLRRLLLGY
ncbi:related to FMO1-flavin-containing monooxygenase [Ustilago bromivora]|uniref:Related to FMO1-flavin-containing monooxygenase n=1 Tax=Ustilago bromivora TaxID=307758 RepID=A0A1K0FXR0_9BASI|nr:related to FMO1-flavin-containing monooxygenase [Ustilago bromivora]